jgi:TRAP-type C4-dicarboxylate transport system substrate-binding protein
MESFKIYDVVKYVSLSNHMWSGFNLLANQSAWNRLPDDIRSLIERNVAAYVRLQRTDQDAMNTRLRLELADRDLAIDDIDPAPFRRQLSGVYASWKARLGARCWSLLEAEAGGLA